MTLPNKTLPKMLRHSFFNRITLATFTLLVSAHTHANAQRLSEQTIQTFDRALTDELARTKEQLKAGAVKGSVASGLVDPFFIQFTLADQERLDIAASNGALTNSSVQRNRQENVRLLIGDYQFNDENFDAGGGGFFGINSSPDNALPIEDASTSQSTERLYASVRRALWLSTDALFKDANETYSKKKAALEHKQLDESVRDLADFARAQPARIMMPPAKYTYDKAQLETLIRELSQEFGQFKNIQSSSVSLWFQDSYQMILNTEGTHAAKPVTVCELKVQASTQAVTDGDPVQLQFTVVGLSPDALPTKAELIRRTRELATNLEALRNAPRFDEKEYTGPVLFENEAAQNFFAENLISRLAAKREDVLGDNGVSALFGSAKKSSLKEKLNTRVLPASMSVIDRSSTQNKSLTNNALGAYPFDDEGVEPVKDLMLIDKGMLQTLYMTRTPTKELREPNGHARSLASALPGMGESAPAPGVVEIIDRKAIANAQMKKRLFEGARDMGYDFALVVRGVQSGAPNLDETGFGIADLVAGGKFIVPQLIYKVNLRTQKEELVRGAEIVPPTSRDLRELITAKETVTRDMLMPSASGGLFSFSSLVPATIIAPRDLLVPELEVHRKKSGANPTLPVVMRP